MEENGAKPNWGVGHRSLPGELGLGLEDTNLIRGIGP